MEKPQHPNYAQFVELKFEKLLMIHSQNLKPLFMQINETVKNVKRFYYRLMPGAIIPVYSITALSTDFVEIET